MNNMFQGRHSRRINTWRRIGGALLAALFLSPMAQAGSMKDVTFFGFGNGPDSLPDADAREGLRSLFAGEEWRWGLPMKLFKKEFGPHNYDPDFFFQTLGTLPSPPWRKTGDVRLPLSDTRFTREGAEIVNVNCFGCHAGVVAGQVVAGLGSVHVDLASFAASTRKLIKKWNNPIAGPILRLMLNKSEQYTLVNFMNYYSTIVLPVMQSQARGENYGPWVVWQHIARMSNPAEGMDTVPYDQRGPLENYLQQPLPPVDPSPWWNIKYKERNFWTQDVNLSSLPTFALNLMDTDPAATDTFNDRMERTRLHLAFAAQTVPPPYPKRDEQDMALVAKGRALFHGEQALANGQKLPCQGCHGQYDSDGRLLNFPNRGIVELSVIGTDPAYATLLHDKFKPLYDHFEKSRFIPSGSSNARWPAVAGYAPPPLKGIWASAPYFHNGSVATVYEVLNSKARRTFWGKNLDPFAYDDKWLGHAALNFNAAQVASMRQAAQSSKDPMSAASLQARQIMDTTAFGRRNTGHTFGDGMNDDERMAVIEFLKRL